MNSKFTKITMICFLLSSIACSHTPQKTSSSPQQFEFPLQVENILAKTENLSQYKMRDVRFNRP